MKKLVLGVTVAALVGVTSSCFAGFGAPKMPKAPGAAKPAATSATTANAGVSDDEINDLTSKQALVMIPLSAAYIQAANAYNVISVLYNNVDQSVFANAKAAEQNPTNNTIKATDASIKKSAKINGKQFQDKLATYNAEQKQKVANGLEYARAYRKAAEQLKATAAITAVPMGAEAAKALKNVGKDISKLGKLNGIMTTVKYYNDIQGILSNYDEIIRATKDLPEPSKKVSEETIKKLQAGEIPANVDFLAE